MHPDDEWPVIEALLQDPDVALINGPTWKTPVPEVSRSLSSVGSHAIIWSSADLPELSVEPYPTGTRWELRSQPSTIQWLRSVLVGSVLTEGRFAIRTDTAPPAAAAGVERRYKMLRSLIRKTCQNSAIEWRSTAVPSRAAANTPPDPQLWVGPRAMAWLLEDPVRCVKQGVTYLVEGRLTSAHQQTET